MNNDKFKRAIIILPSILTSQDGNLGIRLDLLKENISTLEKRGYTINIGTLRKSQPLFNYLKDERLKNWISYYLSEKITFKSEKYFIKNEINDFESKFEEHEGDRLLDMKNIKVEEFDLIIIPSYLNFYEELYDLESNLVELIWNFHSMNKIIILIGHSVFSLTKMMTKNSKNQNDFSIWPFSSFYITGTNISSILDCDFFSNEDFQKFMNKNYLKNDFILNLSVEQEIVDKGGIFVNNVLAEYLNSISNDKFSISFFKSIYKNDEDENDFKYNDENDGNVIAVKCNNLITGNCNNSLKHCINMIS